MTHKQPILSSLPDSFKQLIFYLGVYEWHLHVTDNIKRAWSADGEEIVTIIIHLVIKITKVEALVLWDFQQSVYGSNPWTGGINLGGKSCSASHCGQTSSMRGLQEAWPLSFTFGPLNFSFIPKNKTNTTKCFFLSEINLLFQDHGQRCLLCWGWSVHSGQCYGLLWLVVNVGLWVNSLDQA